MEDKEKQEKIEDLKQWEQYYFKQFEKTGKDKHKQKMIEIKDQLESLGYYGTSTYHQQSEDFKPSYSVYDPVQQKAIENQIKNVNPESLKKRYVQLQRENDGLKQKVNSLQDENAKLSLLSQDLTKNFNELSKYVAKLEQEKQNRSKDKATAFVNAIDKIKDEMLTNPSPEDLERFKNKLGEQEQIKKNRDRGQGPPQSYQKFKPEKY